MGVVGGQQQHLVFEHGDFLAALGVLFGALGQLVQQSHFGASGGGAAGRGPVQFGSRALDVGYELFVFALNLAQKPLVGLDPQEGGRMLIVEEDLLLSAKVFVTAGCSLELVEKLGNVRRQLSDEALTDSGAAELVQSRDGVFSESLVFSRRQGGCGQQRRFGLTEGRLSRGNRDVVRFLRQRRWQSGRRGAVDCS